MKTISASDANRYFSRLLRDVAEGEEVAIVSRGRTVAKITPSNDGFGDREAARRGLIARLVEQQAGGSRDWSRVDLYDR
jgi:prevent-host-death family protein